MEFTGRLETPVLDFETGKIKLILSPEEDVRAGYEELKGCEKLAVTIKKYRKKRSLDANAYYWKLVSMLAKIHTLPMTWLHNKLLREYGAIELFDGRPLEIHLPDTEEVEKRAMESEETHIKPIGEEVREGQAFRVYYLLKGSRRYNTEEFSKLISGTVEECRASGIPDTSIMTPEEKRILKERYGIE